MRAGSVSRLAILVLLVAAAGCGGGDSDDRPRPTTVEAVFEENVPALRRGDSVRVAGVEIGEVAAVRREDGEMIVSMRQKPHQPSGEWLAVGSRAYATIRARIFLEGRYFIDLQPFARSGPFLRDGDRIPPSRTEGPVDIRRLLEER